MEAVLIEKLMERVTLLCVARLLICSAMEVSDVEGV